ncbi:hypothetical protein [Enterococcus bulliens]
MRSSRNRKFIKRMEDFLARIDGEINDLLYSLIQLDLGFYESTHIAARVDEETRFTLYEPTNRISKKDAKVFFDTQYKDEFVKAYNRKYPRSKIDWDNEQVTFDENAYMRFCDYLGV